MLRFIKVFFLIVVAIESFANQDTLSELVKKKTINKTDSSVKKGINIVKPRTTLAKKLSAAEIVSILASIATAASAILTYLLLRETKKTLFLSANVAKRDSKRLEAETISLVYKNFRETYINLMNDKYLLKQLADTHGKKPEETKLSMYGSFLINNVHEIFNLHKNGFISEQVWVNFCVDIEDFFTFPFIEKRWQEIKLFYPESFQIFIGSLNFKDQNSI